MILRSELVRMFKMLDQDTQLEVWNKFVDKNDGKELDLNCFEDPIYSQKEFWEWRHEMYDDSCEDAEVENLWELEVAKTVQLSKNYRYHDTYVRYYYDASVKEWVLESSYNVLDLIKKRYDVPMYEHDVFVEWFEKYVMDKLNE